MNLLNYPKAYVQRLVVEGFALPETIRHWEICEALKKGKKSEEVAEDFKIADSTVRYVRRCKCRD